MAHAVHKAQNDVEYEIDKSRANDPTAPKSTRAGAAANAAGDAIASTYHGAMSGLKKEGQPTVDHSASAACHAAKYQEHTYKGAVNEAERRNEFAPKGDRLTAGAKEAGEKVAAKFHETMANREAKSSV